MFCKGLSSCRGFHSSSLAAKAAIVPIAIGTLALLGMTASAASASNIIYQDFTGSGNPSNTLGSLNGATPVIDNYVGTPTWTAGTTTGDTVWADSGYSNGEFTNEGSAERSSAYLPFIPATGNVYTLSAVMDPGAGSAGGYGTSQSNCWLGIGFLPSTYPNTGTTLAFDSSSSNLAGASPWMMMRSAAGTVIGHVHEIAAYQGPGATSGSVYNPSTIGGTHTETIVLNTQSANWTANYYVDGTNLIKTVTFSSNPNIAYVGVENAAIEGQISNFTLSTPEPASLGLLAIGGAAGLLLLKRRKAV